MTKEKSLKLSTYSGVFTPNILTILGVIMFLRMGYVVGNAGLIQALIILGLAHIVSLTTSFSLSAITTNMTSVDGGGDYYLISRSVGIGYGGAIGIILYLAQTISIALYIIGFTDAITALVPVLLPYAKIISIGVLGFLFIPTFKGADVAAKIQTYILVILGVSIVTFIISSVLEFKLETLQANLLPAYASGNNFWIIFAIFFPAVTGFTQGVSMSGALKDPLKSIPLGTFIAVLAGLAVYLIEMILLGGSASRELLINNYNIMTMISYVPILIILGVFAATLSSALGSFMGSPFILQAITKDRLIPFMSFFGKVDEKSASPRPAVVLTFFIAGACILLGDLNTLAPIITMFFLMSYGMTNYATFIEGYSKNPSFRPTFKFSHWSVSLLGLVTIGILMFMIDARSSVVAFIILFALKSYFNGRISNKKFKDAHTGFYFQRIKDYLIKIQHQQSDFKNWRPQILLLSGNPYERKALIEFGQLIEAKRGILSLIRVIESESETAWDSKHTSEKELAKFIEENKIELFGEVVVAKDFYAGLETIIQSYGFQGIKPNTLVLGWSDKEDKAKKEYLEFIKFAFQFNKNIVIFDSQEEKGLVKDKPIRIDVWWRGKTNGALMLMFAYLIQADHPNAKIRILRIVKDQELVSLAQKQLDSLLTIARINIKIEIIVQDEKVYTKTILEHSKDADLVFMGLAWDEDENNFLSKYETFRKSFKNIALIRSHETLGILE
ncbi:MAG: hypothetical protein A2Y40_04455 [Candidatus Margulisbacteria bacterium GWF2_35_9]|nr:MAG: hypothetical protein A2Y40_04455 [Candidatus Margulisbacteria bacterium GWF2_35_9]